MRELVGEQRGEEEDPSPESGGEVGRGLPVRVDLGKTTCGQPDGDQSEDHQDAPVDPDIDAEDPAETDGFGHAEALPRSADPKT